MSAASAPDQQIPQIVERVAPSIVTIFVQTSQGLAESSGVIWDPGGTIVTNNHVIEGGDVQFASGARTPGHVKATDPVYDLAVVTVGRTGLPPAACSTRLPEVGELAIAMGSPLGSANTVTAGIVSGVHRSIPSGGQAPSLVDLLQTDAPISPGNSGGALLDGAGKVIGINVADLVQRLHISAQSGALVLAVVKGSAAAKAGVKPGDVIVRFGDQPVAAARTCWPRSGNTVRATT